MRAATMHAIVFDQSIRIESGYPRPELRARESIVRVILAGICGTDLEILRGYMDFRGVPGHEFVGCVEQSGRADLVGRRVVGEINAGCSRCAACVGGMARHCPNRTVLGISGRDGAFADYLSLPDSNLLIVPDSVGDEAAVFVEPLAAAFEILEQFPQARAERILVLGDGRLAAAVALVLASEGARVEIAGHHRDKIERIAATDLNRNRRVSIADTTAAAKARKYRIVVDCTGNPSGLRDAIEMVEPRGTIVLKSTASAAEALNLAPIVINEICVIGSRCGRFAPALDALASGRIDPRPLIDTTYPLGDAAAAFAFAAKPSTMKVLLRPN
jgi:threonine dehydrogenase-like Zn-dependent dehydrogenase